MSAAVRDVPRRVATFFGMWGDMAGAPVETATWRRHFFVVTRHCRDMAKVCEMTAAFRSIPLEYRKGAEAMSRDLAAA
jgi:hypothetical protein